MKVIIARFVGHIRLNMGKEKPTLNSLKSGKKQSKRFTKSCFRPIKVRDRVARKLYSTLGMRAAILLELEATHNADY